MVPWNVVVGSMMISAGFILMVEHGIKMYRLWRLMKYLKKQVEQLESRLGKALPIDRDEDGTFGTDGSHEALLNVFEGAFDRVVSVTQDAVNLLKSIQGDPNEED